MRVLVTGGMGFLGRAACRALAARGHAVVSLDRAKGPPLAGVEDRLCDIADGPALAQAMQAAAPQAVVHLATLLTPESARDPVAATRINALGAAEVFAAATAGGAKRIVYAASIAGVGPLEAETGDDAALRPRSVYGATKAFVEHLAGALAAGPGAPAYLGLRFGWVYGPGRIRGWRDAQAMIEAAARGQRDVPCPAYPEPIDWTWIDDAADIVARAVEARTEGHRVFNVVGDRRSVADAAAHLRRRFPEIVLTPYASETPPLGWRLVNDGLAAALGATPATSMEAGIDLLIEATIRSDGPHAMQRQATKLALKALHEQAIGHETQSDALFTVAQALDPDAVANVLRRRDADHEPDARDRTTAEITADPLATGKPVAGKAE